MNWPTTCEGCGATYDSPEDEDVHTNVESWEDGRKMEAYVCLNCIDPSIFPESKRMKKFLAWFNTHSTTEGFLGREEITSFDNFLEK